jgi:2-polyprenyl-6-methoxyphenol hydroxylase-like FAD-dependent oxidoreductase
MRGQCDVAIVGYGPVGQTLAILLGERGWAVSVFEKQPAAYPLPRSPTSSACSMRGRDRSPASK